MTDTSREMGVKGAQEGINRADGFLVFSFQNNPLAPGDFFWRTHMAGTIPGKASALLRDMADRLDTLRPKAQADRGER